MSNWKVIKTKIKLFDHHNADKLDIARVGTYQCVVQKGLYKDGDEVVFAPEKSVLTGRLKDEYSKWLAGPNKDRVHPVVMRGEHSCGIIIPNELIEDLIGDLAQVEEGVDISERLGITKYVPLVPFELAGISEPLEISSEYGKHDCEQFSIYANEFTDGERIVVTEKLHGSQSVYYVNLETKERFVSTKNQLSDGLHLIENESNSLWKAAKNVDLWNIINDSFSLLAGNKTVQVFAELIPVQKGYSYGQTEVTIKIFDVRLNGVSLPYDLVSDELKSLWVPIVHDGPLDKSTVRHFAEGMELVSGKSLHIREGVVVAPYNDRRAEDGTRLRLKIINGRYKSNGEEFN